MKQLCGTSRNLAAIEDDEGLVAVVEVVLDVVEPTLQIDVAGQGQRVNTMNDLRFWTSPKSLRSVAEQFVKWAEEADALLAKFQENP
jgi:hypothetical protein